MLPSNASSKWRGLSRWCAAIALLLALPALAQQAPTPAVETLGQATVYTVPTFADFWIHFAGTGDDLPAAMEAALKFQANFRERMLADKLTPVQADYAPPAIPSTMEARVPVSIFLRFGLGAFSTSEEGASAFAALCQSIASLSSSLGGTAMGPMLDTTDRDTVINSAITAATENAYSAADAVARALNSAVQAVEVVQVLEASWSQPLESQAVEPNLRQLSCTAKVRVTYMLRAPG